MKTTSATIVLIAAFVVSACGNKPDNAPIANGAEDFAARINSGNRADVGQNTIVTPVVAQPLPNAADGIFAPGTATDPAAATCDANRMGPFIARVANAATRMDIETTASPDREIRYLRPGSVIEAPDPESPRLNLILDTQDIIRGARCG